MDNAFILPMTSTYYYTCASAEGSKYSDGRTGIVITKYTVKLRVDQFTTGNWARVLGNGASKRCVLNHCREFHLFCRRLFSQKYFSPERTLLLHN
jgi:hypothetical protein